MATYRLFLPSWRPTPKNALLGRHWGVKASKKRGDLDMIRAYALVNRTPEAKGKRRVSLEIVLTGRQKQVDEDAYMLSLFDALKRSRMIVDDSPRWLEWGGIVYSRDGEPGTTIVLSEVEP